MFDVVAELPMLALILQVPAMPIHIGSRLRWFTLAGITILPRATSSRTRAGSSFSRCDVLHLIRNESGTRMMNLSSIRGIRIGHFAVHASRSLPVRLYSFSRKILGGIVAG